MKTLLRSLALTSALAASLSEAATIVVSDGTFAPANWTYEVRFDVGLSGVTENVTQVGSGGVPGAYRSISYALAHSGVQTYGSVYVINRFADTYTPATQGAISSLTYSENQTRLFADWSPALVGASAALFQDGRVFLGPWFNFGPGNFSWTSLSQVGLGATDFGELVGMNYAPTSHPDFSASGSPLQFGYVRANSYSFSSSLGHAIDNWSFTLETTPIPEPATLSALAGGLALGWVLLRRRRA